MINNLIDSIVTHALAMLLIIYPHLFTAGKILIAIMFIYAGICNIYYRSLKAKVIYDRGIPFPNFVLWVGVITQIACGLCIIFNVYMILATLLLFVFNFFAALIFHDFWNASGDAYRLKMQGFVNNIGIFGALCFLLAASSLKFLQFTI